jgi:hypothetical protein
LAADWRRILRTSRIGAGEPRPAAAVDGGEAGDDDERESRGVIEAAGLQPTLGVEGQLLAEKEILGGQVRWERMPSASNCRKPPSKARTVRGITERPMIPRVPDGPQQVEEPPLPTLLSGRIVSAETFAEYTCDEDDENE